MLNRRPKKTKYMKYQKGRVSYNLPIIKEKILKNIDIEQLNEIGLESNWKENKEQKKFSYQLIACEPYRLTAGHMYAGELAIKRYLKTAIDKGDSSIKGKLELRVFPHLPVTKKPAEVRMGKGKGSIDYWMTRIKIGTPIFEIKFERLNMDQNFKDIENRCYNIVLSAFRIASSKLPVKTKIGRSTN